VLSKRRLFVTPFMTLPSSPDPAHESPPWFKLRIARLTRLWRFDRSLCFCLRVRGADSTWVREADIWLGVSGGGTFVASCGTETPIDDKNETSLSYRFEMSRLDKLYINNAAYCSVTRR
jgi:hypothetical protein